MITIKVFEMLRSLDMCVLIYVDIQTPQENMDLAERHFQIVIHNIQKNTLIKMKTTIKYLAGFSIPKVLPHAGPTDDQDQSNWNWDIFNDEVTITDQRLYLSSNRGETIFPAGSWIDNSDHYTIVANTVAEYDGAYAALNSIWGIKFPECTVGEVESRYGNFPTVQDYQAARAYHNLCKELKGHFFRRDFGTVDHRPGQEILDQATMTSEAIKSLLSYHWHIGTVAQREIPLSETPFMDTMKELGDNAPGYITRDNAAAIASIIFNRKI